MLKQRNCNSFAIFIIILFQFVNCQRNLKDMENQNKASSDFTNSEIDLALSDLSLPELNSLQELIDYADNNDYNYADNSFLNSNSKNCNFNNINNHQNFDLQEDIYNKEPQEKTFQDVIYFQRPPENLMKFSTENERSKREDHQLDKEYLKQLDDSFPRNLEQSNNNDIKLKKDHIRVKRN